MTATRASVWPVGDQPARVQRRGRYLPDSTAHPGKMLPALARRAINQYSQPDDIVIDPMCGIGTTLVEAVHLDRHALGVELEPQWVALANANLDLARAQGATGEADALQGDAAGLGDGLLDDFRGEASLILTSPPYGASVHGHVAKAPGRVMKFNDRYSRNPENLAHLPQQPGRRARRPGFQQVLAEILAGCTRMLAPGGHLVLTARPYRLGGQLIDLPGQLEQLAKDAGLTPHDRHVALLCGLQGDRVVPHASFFQIQIQRTGAFPRMRIIAHEDVLVFRKPTITTSSWSLDVRLGK